MTWRESAACREMDMSVFFPMSSRPGIYDEARAVCASCPVREECLADALEDRFDVAGFRGGMAPAERKRLRSTGRRCEVDGCDRPHRCKGLCKLHYTRKRQGNPLVQGEVSPERVLAVRVTRRLARLFGVDPGEVWGASKERRIAECRHWVWWVLCESGLSLNRVGWATGRPHSSVAYGVRQARRRSVPVGVRSVLVSLGEERNGDRLGRAV